MFPALHNAAATVLTHRNLITPVMKSFLWISLKYIYKVLNVLALQYISNLLPSDPCYNMSESTVCVSLPLNTKAYCLINSKQVMRYIKLHKIICECHIFSN